MSPPSLQEVAFLLPVVVFLFAPHAFHDAVLAEQARRCAGFCRSPENVLGVSAPHRSRRRSFLAGLQVRSMKRLVSLWEGVVSVEPALYQLACDVLRNISRPTFNGVERNHANVWRHIKEQRDAFPSDRVCVSVETNRQAAFRIKHGRPAHDLAESIATIRGLFPLIL
jgi:hypothetical protein